MVSWWLVSWWWVGWWWVGWWVGWRLPGWLAGFASCSPNWALKQPTAQKHKWAKTKKPGLLSNLWVKMTFNKKLT